MASGDAWLKKGARSAVSAERVRQVHLGRRSVMRSSETGYRVLFTRTTDLVQRQLPNRPTGVVTGKRHR